MRILFPTDFRNNGFVAFFKTVDCGETSPERSRPKTLGGDERYASHGKVACTQQAKRGVSHLALELREVFEKLQMIARERVAEHVLLPRFFR